MTQQHTPGPWHVDGIHIGAQEYIIARVELGGTLEGQANARLMAVAPELLDALRLCLGLIVRLLPQGRLVPFERRIVESAQAASIKAAVIVKATREIPQ